MTRFAISSVREGPRDLCDQLPVTARTVDVRNGPDGQTYFCAHLDKPIKYHTDTALVSGTSARHNGADEAGEYVWVRDIVMRSSDPTAQPHYGMQSFPVEVAYVTDPSYNADEHLDFGKILPVAAAEIDGLDEESTLLFERPSLAELEALAKPSAAVNEVSDPDSEGAGAAEPSTPVPAAGEALPDPVVDFEQTVVGIPIPDHLRAPSSPTSRPVEIPVATSPPAPLASYGTARHRRYQSARPSKGRLVVSAVGVAAVILVAIIAWRALTAANDGSAPISAPAAATLTPSASDVQALKAAVPKGYSDNSCQEPPAATDPSLTCGPNADAGGPQSATYTRFTDRAALDRAFASAIAPFDRVQCPGNLQSPGPWRRGPAPNKVEGNLFCGNRDGHAVVVWTNQPRSLLYVAEAGEQLPAPTLDQLYTWWAAHA